MKRILDLSYRTKIPLWGSLLIILATLVVSGSLMFKAYDDMREDLFVRSSGLAYRLAESLFQPLMEDDTWQAFEIISKALDVANTRDILQPNTILIIDNELKVLIATDPMLIPRGTRVDQLTPEYGVLVEQIQKLDVSGRTTYETQDKKNYYVTAPVVNEGYRLGTVIVVNAKDSLWPRFVRIASHGALTGLLVLAILLPANWYWGMRLSRPLVLITERMTTLSSATAEEMKNVSYPYHDEVGQLFEAYQHMQIEQSNKQALEKQVVHSERLAAVGHLAAGVAHEINNPLGGMLTAIDTLRSVGSKNNRAFDSQTAKTISLIERGLTQIKETVSALLVEARVRTRDLEPQDFEDIRSLVVPQAQSKQLLLDWRSSLARSLPLQANQVRQILINLLLNAIHAANLRGTVICVIEERNQKLHLQVENDGKQLSSEQMSHLFEPFSPLSKTGHGLGLWVTYQIVQQLGGDIRVEQHNGNIVFSVSLPFVENTTA
ncbi:MAG: hypothetical protein AUK51_16640 [Comamonadaceae bacterium CG2_30_59_20]|nr:MAG: hypothetical protein AUK51_16640 [Comamonadaceae bacterium CG2_30_59_20]